MKLLSKVLNIISAILFFLAITFLYGTCGSLDLNKITYQQGIERIVWGFIVVVLAAGIAIISLWIKGEVLKKQSENEEEETEETRQSRSYYNIRIK